MPLSDFLRVLYEETQVEICVDFDPLYTGTVEDVPLEKFASSRVIEAYISLDGKSLVISVNRQRNFNKK